MLGGANEQSFHRNQENSARSSNVVMDRLLSCFLTNLDGVVKLQSLDGNAQITSTSNLAKVVVIATTRNASNLDSSILRPGRLEEHFTLKYLNAVERKQIIQHFVKLSIFDDEKVDPADVAELVEITSGW